MYTNPEDARSDLLLAGAVFVFGGIILQILLELIPLGRIPGVAPVLAVVLPLVTTVLVPYLLIRYRQEPWSMYGLGSFSPSTFVQGLVLAAPLVVAGVVFALIAGINPVTVLPLVNVPLLGSLDAVVLLLNRLATWLGYVLLAVYGTVKARDAFRSYPEDLGERARMLLRILGIAVAIAAGLLLLANAAQGGGGDPILTVAGALLPPLGVASGAVMLIGQLDGHSTTTKAALITPVVLMALAAAFISFNAAAFVRSIYFAAIFGLIGLMVGVLQESRGSAWGAVGIGLLIATASTFGQGLMLR